MHICNLTTIFKLYRFHTPFLLFLVIANISNVVAKDHFSLPQQLNGKLVTGGDVLSPISISANGQTVVYLADQITDGINELFSVPIKGGTAIRLSNDLSTQQNVVSFQISPDNQFVLYLSGQNTFGGTLELFKVPLAGGTPERLSKVFTSGQSVIEFQVSSNSKYVIYRAGTILSGIIELFSVPILGGDSERLNSDITEGGDVRGFIISPDSSRVVYQGDLIIDNVNELFSVPIDGGISQRLNNNIIANGDVQPSLFNGFKVSPNSEYVVYVADQITDNVNEIFSVPINGGISERLNTQLVTDGNVQTDFQISPDSQRVVYRADQITDETIELFSVPIRGGEPVRLNSSLRPGSNVSSGFLFPNNSFQISLDGENVIYRANQRFNSVFELFSVPISGGLPIRINGELPIGGNVIGDFEISNDSLHVVYRASQGANRGTEIYSTSVSASLPVRLNANLVPGGNVAGGSNILNIFRISPDSQSVVYLSDQNIDGVTELFNVSINGENALRLNDDLPAFSDIDSFQISLDNQSVVYLADQDVNGQLKVFSVQKNISGEEFCFPIPTKNNNLSLICL